MSKYNSEIVGRQYEIRELIIINFIEWYASEEKEEILRGLAENNLIHFFWQTPPVSLINVGNVIF